MTVNKKTGGTAVTMPAGLSLGAVASMLVTFLCAAILAKLIDSEAVPEDSIGYGIMVLLVLSSYIGAMVASKRIKRKMLTVCVLSGVVYMAMLLGITALFFGGQYQAVGVTALLVMCGIGLAVLTHMQQMGRGKRRIRKGYHR